MLGSPEEREDFKEDDRGIELGGAKPMSATAAEEREARLLRMSVNQHETLAAESVEEREQRRLVWCSLVNQTTPSEVLDARLET